MTEQLLAADLAPGTGARKERLVARCWVAANYGAECGLNADDYETFRDAWVKQTFDKLHTTFDHLLPPQFRAKTPGAGTGQGRARQAKQANGLTPAQQIKFDKFLKCTERVARGIEKANGFFTEIKPIDQAHRLELEKLIGNHRAAAAFARNLNETELLGLWTMNGLRTGGDLEAFVENMFKI